jgi:hypothetical protein
LLLEVKGKALSSSFPALFTLSFAQQNMGQRQSQPAAVDAASNTSISQSATSNAFEAKLNPPAEDARSHNFGQPIQPSDGKKNASKLLTDCTVQQRASLQCIEENYENKDVACAPFFEEYKKCRREEHERKLERNSRAF